MPDTDLSARVWPEDSGTGTSEANADWDSAGYIAGMAAKDNASDYVEAGLGITPDYATPAFDLAAGLAFIKYTGSVSIQLPGDDSSTYSGTWDQGVTFAVDVDQQTGIGLTDGAVNRVYLATDLTTNDGAYVRVDTEASPNVPTDPYIKIAEIDTSSDTTTEVNRRPDMVVGDLDIHQLASALDVAGYDITNAGTIEGQSASVSGQLDAALAEVGEINTVTRLRPGDDLANKTVSGAQHMVLPIGTCTISSTLGSSETLVVSGQGMDETTIRNDSTDILWADYNDAPDSDIVFKDLTIDMDEYAFQRGIYIAGSRREVRFENVRIENFNLGSLDRDGFISVAGGIDPVIDHLHVEGCVWDLSDVTNRSQFHAVSTSATSPVTTARIVGNRHRGSLAPDHSDPIRGYMIRVNESGIIRDNFFKEIDQYGTMLEGSSDGASVKVVNNTSVDSGYGDFFRAGASSSSGVSVEISGNSWRGRPPSEEGADRALIVDNSQAPDLVKVVNNDVSDSLLPVEISAGKNIVVKGNIFRRFGIPDSTDTRPGIQIRDTDGVIEDVSVTGNVLMNDSSTSNRYAVGVQLDEINSNWSGLALVANNIINGPSTIVENNVTSISPTIRDNET